MFVSISLCVCVDFELIKESDSHLSVYRTRGTVGGTKGGITDLYKESKLKNKYNPALKNT